MKENQPSGQQGIYYREVQDSNSLMRTVIDSTDSMISVLEAIRDKKGRVQNFRYLYSNQLAKKYDPAKEGDLLTDVQPAVKPSGVLNKYMHVVDTGEPAEFELNYNSPGTAGTWFHVRVEKMGDRIIVFAHDITRKQVPSYGSAISKTIDKTQQELSISQGELLQAKDELAQRAADKYQELFETIPQGYCVIRIIRDEHGKAIDYEFLEINAAFEKQTGIKNAVGRRMKEIEPLHEANWFSILGEVSSSGKSKQFEQKAIPLMGGWYEVFAYRGENHGSDKVALLFSDITVRKTAELLQNYLLMLCDSLHNLSDPEEIEEQVARVALNYFDADRCYYCSIEADQAVIRRVASRRGLARVAGTYPLSSFPIFKKAVDAGKPFVVEDAHTTPLLDEELRALCLQLQVVSFLDVPVMKNGEAVGIFCLVQSQPRKWTDIEKNLAIDTADRIWLAVEKVKAEKALRELEARQTFLLELGDKIYTLGDPAEIAFTACAALGKHLGVARCLYGETDEDDMYFYR